MIVDLLYFGAYNVVSFGLLIYYLDIFFTRKDTKYFYIWVGTAAILFSVLNAVYKNPDYNFPGTLFLYFLLSIFLFKGSIFRKIVLLLLFIAFSVMIEGIFFLMNNILNLDPKATVYFWGILSQITTLLIVLSLNKTFKEIHDYNDRRISVFILILSLFSLVYISLINTFLTSQEAKLIALISGMIILFTLIFIYKYIEIQNKNRNILKQKEDLERNIAANSQYYSMIDNYQKEVRRLKHDMKNKLLALYQMEEKEKNAFLSQELTAIDAMGEELYSRNPLVNFILHQKLTSLEIAENRKEISCDIPEEIPMNSGDFGVLFGNLLDNIVEGLEKLPVEQRELSIRIYKKGFFFIMETENSCIDNINPNRTSKKNHSKHGYGIKSIQAIAEKYNGKHTITIEGNVFKNNIKLPIYMEA